MSGWYPDPGGAPGRFRYWNGQTWSATTTPDPVGAPVPDDVRTPAAGSRRDREGRGWLIALIVLALVTVVAIVAVIATSGRGPFGPGGATEDTNSSTPTVSAWDETSTPTVPPPTSSSADMVACPITTHRASTAQVPGRITSSRLSSATNPDWGRYDSWYYPFTYDIQYQTTDIVPYSWFAGMAVSRIAKEDWTVGLPEIADRIGQCISTSQYYHSITRVVPQRSQAYVIDGHAAYWVTIEVQVSDPPDVDGDRVDVIVVDLGEDLDHYGLFSSACTLDQTLGAASCAAVDAAIESLSVS